MASAPSPSTAASGSTGYDEFVDSRIARTRAAVKTADLATGAGVLIAWALFVLLVAAVADHWLVAGGLDRVARYALWGVGLAGAGLYVATRLGPTMWLSVNPLYAAREIERESPDLKNSLLNLLQLRGGAETTAVRRTLERQAAERLAKSGDAPIDHTPLLRVAKLLLALVAVIGVYVVASPKDFFASAGRVIAPWSQVAAPSRVRFDSVEPGSIKVSQGEQIKAETMVTGLRDGDLVELVYSTADGRVVNRRVPMRPSEGGLHFSGTLPPGGGAAAALGVQGDLTYRLEAGDARTPNYRVRVLTSPTIAPVSVRYDYPAYTGYASRETEGVGDLRALEGTRVTITAEANLLVDTAQIDLGADGRPDVRMKVDWKRATGAFALRLDGDGPTSSTSYVMRFTSTDGQANHDPPQYRVEVIGDLPPEAAILEPVEETLDVPLNRPTALAIEARDPDFALKRVRLIGESGGRRLLERDLLTGDGRGKFVAETSVTPQKIGLRPGDVLDYWVEATDNRTPNPGTGRSQPQRLRVAGPANGNGDGQQRDGQQRDGQQREGGATRDGDRGEGSPQDGQPGANGANEPGAQGGESRPGQPGERGQQGPDQQRPDQQGAGQQEQGGPSRDGQEQQGPDQQDQQGDQEQRSGEQPPSAGAEQRPNNQKQHDEGEDGERGEGNNPPPGGLTGPSNDGGDDPPGEPTEGQGTEGSGSSDAGDQNSGAGGSQSGNDSGAQQQRRPGGDGGEGGKSQGAEEGAGGEGEPVARDGADDGSAFERIQEYLKNQQGSDGQGQPGQTRERRPGEQGDDNPSGETRDAAGQPSGASEGQSEDRSGQNDPADGEGANHEGQGAEGDRQDGSENGEARPRDSEGGERADPSEDGLGAGERDRSGASSDSTSGESGGDTPPGESTDPQEGPRQGTDGAGQSQSADRGAGQSADPGAGDSSGRPGGEESSDTPTGGESGDEAGPGSQSRESSDRSKKGDTESSSGESQGDQGAGGEGSSSGSEGGAEGPDSISDRRGEGAQDSQGGKPSQRGGPKELVDRGTTADGPGEGSEVGGDDANLDYAREQTDLVLERLEEQLREKEVDRRLLDKLGWTEDDLRRFVDRWRTRKRQAAQRGAEGEAQLDRALRSLGLEPGGPTTTRKTTDDSLRDLRERTRTKTPPRLREALERYNRSLNASGPPSEDD